MYLASFGVIVSCTFVSVHLQANTYCMQHEWTHSMSGGLHDSLEYLILVTQRWDAICIAIPSAYLNNIQLPPPSSSSSLHACKHVNTLYNIECLSVGWRYSQNLTVLYELIMLDNYPLYISPIYISATLIYDNIYI